MAGGVITRAFPFLNLLSACSFYQPNLRTWGRCAPVLIPSFPTHIGRLSHTLNPDKQVVYWLTEHKVYFWLSTFSTHNKNRNELK